MNQPTPFGPLQCGRRQSITGSHECQCIRHKRHNDSTAEEDAWHVCECGTKWTDEREAQLGGEAKVIQLRRIPTDVAFDGQTKVQAPEITDTCPICGLTGGMMIEAELGQWVHPECRPAWVFLAETGRHHATTIITLSRTQGPEIAWRYAARVLGQLQRGK